MKILQRCACTVLTLVALSFVAVGCTTMGSTAGDEQTFKRVSGETHRQEYPGGHTSKKGHSCHYDQGADVFFCSFSE
jgi:hypothetical protein